MSRRIMIGLFVLSMVAFPRTEAHAGCADFAGFFICASWITGSAKCLASTSDTLAISGRCEIGGTLNPPPGMSCGPVAGSEFLTPCNIQGVLSCSNEFVAPSPSTGFTLLSGTTPPPSDDGGATGTPPRFIKRTAVVSDAEFDKTQTPPTCDRNDCRVNLELDLSERSGEAACNAQGLAGFDTFTPATGFMKAQFVTPAGTYTLIEKCTTIPAICGVPYFCREVARLFVPPPRPGP